MKCRQPYWKCQGKVGEFDLVWRVVTLDFTCDKYAEIIGRKLSRRVQL